ncbi:MAG: hypothetical protein A2Y07_04820 [Planctomycetes bacterium GWF2_50_10]|nr:MAG: hypothetical protein A2Y07_04820 [Planctomycetes bacterium GWF2_50_10]
MMLETVCKKMSAVQLDQLKKFGDRARRFDAAFVVLDGDGSPAVVCASNGTEPDCSSMREFARSLFEAGKNGARIFASGQVIGTTLRAGAEVFGAAFLNLGGGADAKMACCAAGMLDEMTANFESTVKAQEQIEMISAELAQTYEELVLLYKMSTSMKVTESDANYLQMACDSLTDLVNVEGIAILIEKTIGNVKRPVLTAGSGLIDIDEKLANVLFDRLNEQVSMGKEALLDSEVDSKFRYSWPGRIKNIIAVPLYSNEKVAGLMVAVNRLDKPDFDSIDVKLFNSVANECAVFIENIRLFTDLKELFIGSLKALTNSIDAKDQYTRGHSERVAFISRWIAEKLGEEEPLDEQFIHRIYLAGLLHDIGKIGISEALLCKNGALSDEERNQIKSHPAIGSNILSDIKLMADIVPGVLCHHERMDGKGYPGGLKGEEIPLIGKIVMIADAFDAMTSKRVYRNAMDIQKALSEMEKGLGTQFDEKIGRLFIKHAGYELWKILQDGMVEQARAGLGAYGTSAVGALLR